MGEFPLPSQPAAFRLAFPCELVRVRPAVQEVRAFLAVQGCVESDLTDCDLALVEACTNAVKFASESPTQPLILIEVLCDSCEFELRVTDSGPGFDWPEQVPLPEPESESGRGL